MSCRGFHCLLCIEVLQHGHAQLHAAEARAVGYRLKCEALLWVPKSKACPGSEETKLASR